MARADLLLELVQAGARGDLALFRKVLEAMVAEERAKQHHVLADRLAQELRRNGGQSQVEPKPTPRGQEAPFHELVPKRRLDELVLSDMVRQACWELVEEHRRADLLRSYGLEPRNRVLLAGPPGNGKTTLAEAIAAELMVPLLVVRYELLITSYLGETAARLARLFDMVRARQCVLFFDEFDVVGKERGDIHETGEIKRVVSSLLVHVDMLPSYSVVITASNHPELLDRAVWRRFQLRLDMPAPTRRLVEQWLADFESQSGFDFGLAPNTIARRLGPVSFAELEQFTTDLKRRYILAKPSGDPQQIARSVLLQWESRTVQKGHS